MRAHRIYVVLCRHLYTKGGSAWDNRLIAWKHTSEEAHDLRNRLEEDYEERSDLLQTKGSEGAADAVGLWIDLDLPAAMDRHAQLTYIVEPVLDDTSARCACVPSSTWRQGPDLASFAVNPDCAIHADDSFELERREKYRARKAIADQTALVVRPQDLFGGSPDYTCKVCGTADNHDQQCTIAGDV